MRSRRVAGFRDAMIISLGIMPGMSYTQSMSTTTRNIVHLRPEGDAARATRAQFIHGLLKSERWSVRQAALAMGMTSSVLATRMNGSTPFLADELEKIAELLKRDPVKFYAEYLEVGRTGLEPVTDGL